MDKNVEQVLADLATQVADECGYELVEVNLLGQGKKALLRVFIDKEGGITLHDCEVFSRSFETLLDVEDPIAGPYTLEVSSPGLDRPLKNLHDFRRSVGKLVRIVTKENISSRSFFVGRLTAVNGDILRLSIADSGEEIALPLASITKARLEIELK
jgi:ribosome maturation factor RimP